jgi:hypothetical protein
LTLSAFQDKTVTQAMRERVTTTRLTEGSRANVLRPSQRIHLSQTGLILPLLHRSGQIPRVLNRCYQYISTFRELETPATIRETLPPIYINTVPLNDRTPQLQTQPAK